MAQKTPDQFKQTSSWQAFTKEYGSIVSTAAKQHGVPEDLLGRLLWQESRGNTSAVSVKGAKGVAQFMPDTAKDMGVGDPHDPRVAIPAAAKYLSKLKSDFGDSDWERAVAAYNYGPTRLKGKAWPFDVPAETRDYVRLVHGTDPWPNRDRDGKGQRPGLEALQAKMPVELRPVTPAESKSPSVQVRGDIMNWTADPPAPYQGDPFGPLTAGLAPTKSGLEPLKPMGFPRALQGEVYFTDAAAQQNLETVQRAGEISMERARADQTGAEKYDAAVRMNHVIPNVQAALRERQAAELYGDTNWRLPTVDKAVADLEKAGVDISFAPRLLEARGASHYAAILSSMEQESAANRVIETSGFWSSLGYGTLAGLSDPALAALNAPSVGLPAAIRGATMAARAIRGAAFGVGMGLTAELPLQFTQETRQLDEALGVVVGSAVLGGALNVPGGPELSKLAQVLRKHRDGTLAPKDVPAGAAPGDVAVQAPPVQMDTELVPFGPPRGPKRDMLRNPPFRNPPPTGRFGGAGDITVGGMPSHLGTPGGAFDYGVVDSTILAIRGEPPTSAAPPGPAAPNAITLAIMKARAKKWLEKTPTTVEDLQKSINESAAWAQYDKAGQEALSAAIQAHTWRDSAGLAQDLADLNEIEARVEDGSLKSGDALVRMIEAARAQDEARVISIASERRIGAQRAPGSVILPASMPDPKAAGFDPLFSKIRRVQERHPLPGDIEIKAIPRAYQPDEEVWVGNPAQGEQFSAKIVKELPDGLYLVEDADGRKVRIHEDEIGDGFLPGSIGAAQVSIVNVAARPFGGEATPSAWGAEWARFDASGALRNQRNVVGEWYGATALTDGVGLSKTGEAIGHSVEEVASMQREAREAKLSRGLNAVFAEMDHGQSRWGRAERRKAFEEQVLDYYENAPNWSQVPNAALWQKGVAELNELFDGYRQWLKASGVEYAKNLDTNQHYAPHVIHITKFREMVDLIGAQQVKRLLATSLENRWVQREGMGVSGPLRAGLQALANGYVEGVLRRGHWGDMIGLHGLTNDRPSLKALLQSQPGVTPEQVEAVMQVLEGMGSGGSGPQRFKHRFDFDMGTGLKVRDKNGQDVQVRMRDLYVRHASDLAAMYGRQVSGHAAFAEVMGIRSRMDHENWKLKAVEAHQGNDKQMAKTLRLMDYAYDAITGRPFEDDPMSAFNVWGRRLRDFNFLRLMGQVGFAQIAEFGRTVSTAGWKAMYQQMPALRDVFRMAKDGQLDNQLLRELEAISGIGTHRLRQTLVTVGDDTMDPVGSRVDELLHKGKMLTADISGMSWLTTMQQRMAGAAIAQNIANLARKGAPDDRLLSSLGLSADDWKFISAEIQANTKFGTGGRVHELNTAAMDPEAANLLALAIRRGVRRVVQESEFGTSLPFMHKTVGQLLFQFRGFGMNAIFKQTMQGLAQRDANTAAAFFLTSMLGGLSYVVQTSLNEPDKDRLEEKLALDRVAKAGFNRSGYMSMIPSVVDSTISWGSGGTSPGFFNGRTTPDLGSDLIGGNPSVSAIGNAQRTVAALFNAPLRDDYDLSRADLRAGQSLVPVIGNAVGIKRAFAALGADLPRESSTNADLFSNSN